MRVAPGRAGYWLGVVAVFCGSALGFSPLGSYATASGDQRESLAGLMLSLEMTTTPAPPALAEELAIALARAPVEQVRAAISGLAAAQEVRHLDIILERAAVSVPHGAHVGLLGDAAYSYPYRPLPAPLAARLGATASAWIRYGRGRRWWREERHCEPNTRQCELEEGVRSALIAIRNLLERGSQRAEPLDELRAALRGAHPPCVPPDESAPSWAATQHLAELWSVDIGIEVAGCDALPTLAERTPLGARWRGRRLVSTFEPETEVVRLGPWGDPRWDTAPVRVVPYRERALPGFSTGRLVVLRVGGLWRVVGHTGSTYHGYLR